MAVFRVRWSNGVVVIRQAGSPAKAAANGLRESGSKVLQVELLNGDALLALDDAGYVLPVAVRARVARYKAERQAMAAAREKRHAVLAETKEERQRAFDEANQHKQDAKRVAREVRERARKAARRMALAEARKAVQAAKREGAPVR